MISANDTPVPAHSFLPFGDKAMTVQFGEGIDVAANEAVIRLGDALEAAPFIGLVELVPTYRSLLVIYDPLEVSGASVEDAITERLQNLSHSRTSQRRWVIPTWYGGEAALDLETLSQEKGITSDELIALHQSAEYRVFMIGFAPGFTYLGGVPEALHSPRMLKPRQLVPAGAIGIGGQQASINSVAGPSAWRFIGQTPVRAFDPAREQPFLFMAGDIIRFSSIPEPEAQDLFQRVAAGETIIEPEVNA